MLAQAIRFLLHGSGQTSQPSGNIRLSNFFGIAPPCDVDRIGKGSDQRRIPQRLLGVVTRNSRLPTVEISGGQNGSRVGVLSKQTVESPPQILEREKWMTDVSFRPIREPIAILLHQNVPRIEIAVTESLGNSGSAQRAQCVFDGGAKIG